MRRLANAIVAVLLTACSDPAPTAPASPAFDATPPPPPDAARTVGTVSASTGIAAWQAVLDRARYLHRRGGSGTVVGILGAPTGDPRWLVDDTEGHGVLAIRVALPPYARALDAGQRIEAAGAWIVDADRRWVWRATDVARIVDPDAKPAALSFEPGLAIGSIDAAPDGAVPASAAARGADIVFTVVAPPAKPGDGWLIADAPGADAIAWLVLPGEGAAYGGQDMLAADERWQLTAGRQYTVKVARRPRRSAGLQLLNASGPPRRIE